MVKIWASMWRIFYWCFFGLQQTPPLTVWLWFRCTAGVTESPVPAQEMLLLILSDSCVDLTWKEVVPLFLAYALSLLGLSYGLVCGTVGQPCTMRSRERAGLQWVILLINTFSSIEEDLISEFGRSVFSKCSLKVSTSTQNYDFLRRALGPEISEILSVPAT